MVHQINSRWRRLREVILRIVTFSLLIALVLAALAPSLVPSSYLARAVREALEASLGRPVQVGRCSLGWFTGLTVDEIRVPGAPGRPGESLLDLQQLRLHWQPWELVGAITAPGAPGPHLGRVTVGKLNLNLVRDAEGRLDLPAFLAAPPATGAGPDGRAALPEFKSIDILDGDLLYVDRRTGDRRLLSRLRLTMGRLEGTTKVYLTAGGRLMLPNPDPAQLAGAGLVSVNGLLDHLDLNDLSALRGGCDLQWSNVDLGYLLPQTPMAQSRRAGARRDGQAPMPQPHRGQAGAGPLALEARTDGQASLRLGDGETVALEGAVSAPRLALGQTRDPAELKEIRIERPTLSFTGSYHKTTGELVLKVAQIAGAGSSIRVEDGRLERAADGALRGHLRLRGTLSWSPLKREVPVLGRVLEEFTSAAGPEVPPASWAGTATVDDLDLTLDGGLLEVRGAVDLSRTELVWRPYFQKQADERASFELHGRLDLTTGELDLEQALLRLGLPARDALGASGPARDAVGASGPAPAEPAAALSGLATEGAAGVGGATPAPSAAEAPAEVEILARTVEANEQAAAAGSDARAASRTSPEASSASWVGRRLLLELRLADAAALPRHVPAAAELVENFRLSGPVTASAAIDPGAPGLPATVRLDATGLGFESARNVGKRAGMPLELSLAGVLRGHENLPECHQATLVMGDSRLTWTGAVRAEMAAQAPMSQSRRAGTGRDEPAPMPQPHRRLCAAFEGRLEAREVQEWIRLLRPHFPARPFVGALGHLTCDLKGRLGREELVIDWAELDASLASLEVNTEAGHFEESSRLFVKRLGRPAGGTLRGSLRMNGPDGWSSGELTMKATVNVADSTIDLEAAAAGLGRLLAHPGAPGRAEASGLADDGPAWPDKLALEATVLSNDVAALLASFPAVSARLAPYEPRGAINWHLSCHAAERVRLRTSADLTDLAYVVPPYLTKARGLSQNLTLDLECPRSLAAGTAEFRLAELSCTAGPSRLDSSGRVVFDTDALRKGGARDVLLRAARSGDLNVKVDLVQNQSLLDFCTPWRELSERYQVEGRGSAEVRLTGSHEGGSLVLILDATPAGFQYGQETRKPAGTPARVELTARTTPLAHDAVEASGLAGELEVEKLDVDIADAHMGGRGTVYGRDWFSPASGGPLDFAVRLEGRARQLARLMQLVPVRRLRDLELQGGVEFALDVARDRYGVELRDARMNFDGARMRYHGAEVGLDGTLRFNRRRLLAEALALKFADSQLVLVADVADPLEAPTGEFALSGTHLDLDQILRVLGVQPAEAAPQQVGIPPEWLRLRSFLKRMDMRGRVALDRFVCIDPGGLHYDWRAFVTDLELSRGRLRVPDFKAVMMGGVVIGRLASDLTEDNPEIFLEYATRNLQGADELAPMIQRFFPDMTVSGTAGQTYQARSRLFATAEAPNYPVGLSEFQATDGEMQGPAAPDWLTGLLPGLKLTKYHFKRMCSRSELRPDGRSDSQMLFDGAPYAVYIDGYTEADGRASYTLGVDFLNSINLSEPLRSLEQGRVPLLVYSGRIAGSKWVERNISYKLPHEVAWEVFLKRSLLFKLLHQRGETRRPDFEPYKLPQEPQPDAPKNPPDAGR